MLKLKGHQIFQVQIVCDPKFLTQQKSTPSINNQILKIAGNALDLGLAGQIYIKVLAYRKLRAILL